MQYANTDQSIVDWVNQVFTGRVLNQINLTLEILNRQFTDMRQIVIYSLLVAIIRDCGTYRGTADNGAITSWLIKQHLQMIENQDIGQYFGITPSTETATFPVSVSIGGNMFVHEMGFELVLGILVFYNEIGQMHPLSLFGDRFTDYDPYIKDEMRHAGEYSVNVNNTQYIFDDTEFMRGLLTAAAWTNIDPHSIITNLREFLPDTSLNFN